MGSTFKVKISDLRGIIREFLEESMIEEKFGEKIGDQYAGPGVADERDKDECMSLELDEGGAKDLRGHTCEKCKKAKYEEMSVEDDWGGWLHCAGCNHRVKRWKTDEVAPKGYEKVVKGMKKDSDVKNPWAVAWSMKKKGVKPKK